MTEHVTGTRRGGRLAGAGALAVIAAACTLVVSTARPAEATSLGTRWGGTVDFHMIRVTRSPLVANPGSTAQWQEETVEASVHWRFDQPPPKSRAPDDLVKDVNARGRARASAGDHVVSTDPDGSADCYAPAREDASGTASFDDLVEIDYAYDPDPAKKGWNLLLGIDDEFPYNKPPYQPREVDLPGTTVPFPGCPQSTFAAHYSVPKALFVGGPGVKTTTTSIRGIYRTTVACNGIVQDPSDPSAGCEDAPDWTDRLEVTVTVDLRRATSSNPSGTPGAPVIRGLPKPGNTLTLSLPGWTAAERKAARFRWSHCWGPYRCAGTPASPTSHYLIRPSDTGARITVTATSVVNRHAFTLRSAPTAPVGASGGATPPAGR